jgi:mersacidin/lichenicidin family type 2 lantibiotic
MSFSTIINAWKDSNYRQNLDEEMRALLPEHPAGLLELTDEELALVAGGKKKKKKEEEEEEQQQGQKQEQEQRLVTTSTLTRRTLVKDGLVVER